MQLTPPPFRLVLMTDPYPLQQQPFIVYLTHISLHSTYLRLLPERSISDFTERRAYTRSDPCTFLSPLLLLSL